MSVTTATEATSKTERGETMTPNRTDLAQIRIAADRIRRSPSAEGHVDTLAVLLIDLIDAIDPEVEAHIARQHT